LIITLVIFINFYQFLSKLGSKMSNLEILHNAFISNLEKHYGEFNKTTNKFEVTSNSKIARDLFYSDSQFSRLINNTASEGELTRAVENVQRLLDIHALRKQIKSEKTVPKIVNKKLNWKIIIGVLSAIIVTIISTAYLLNRNSTKQVIVYENSKYDMLKWSFENNYIKPYITLQELPDDCNFPCYKYQGKWKLKKEYKIPIFRERNGFHYVAKEVVMYASCSDKTVGSGANFDGYEYQKHEIWYDRREYPIDSFLVKGSNSKIRPAYSSSIFENDPNFVKIAYVHTFFMTHFKINNSEIQRSGKAIGRDVEFITDKKMLEKLKSKSQMEDLKNEIRSIANNRLQDFSKPISCNSAKVPKEDFNLVQEGDELSFDCQFSTGHFLVDYNKTYILIDQYINNRCR
jgi:hypothetical protein